MFYSGNNGRSGFIDFNGRFTAQNALKPGRARHRRSRFHAGPARPLGPRPAERHLGPALLGDCGIFFQDDYRVSKNLTLNLGLRWQYNTPWVEVENRQSNFGLIQRPAAIWPANPAARISDCRALYNSYKKDFQPRVGFAYTPRDPGQEACGPRRLHDLFVPGRHRHQPANAAESAVRIGIPDLLQHAGHTRCRARRSTRAFRLNPEEPLRRRDDPLVGSTASARRSRSSGTCRPSMQLPRAATF